MKTKHSNANGRKLTALALTAGTLLAAGTSAQAQLTRAFQAFPGSRPTTFPWPACPSPCSPACPCSAAVPIPASPPP